MTPVRWAFLLAAAALAGPGFAVPLTAAPKTAAPAKAVSPSPGRQLLDRAEALYSGTGGRVDQAGARALFEKAAATGDPVARLRLATLYQLGVCGIHKDPARAAEIARPVLDAVRGLADTGDPVAQTQWGTALLMGIGLPANPAAALPVYLKAAERGQTWAQYNLGWMYASGTGVKLDLAQSYPWYLRAAEAGNASAMREVATFFFSGKGKPKNPAEGMVWLRKAIAAGDPRILLDLLDWFENLPPAELDKAVAGFREQAKAGNPHAMAALAHVTAYENYPTYYNPAAAFKWAEGAAGGGSVLGMRMLGQCLSNGWGTARNLPLARQWYRKAADADDLLSLYWLGQTYIDGEDPRQGYELYRQAADRGFHPAIMDLAHAYENGWNGLPRDRGKARAYYQKGADQGDPEAIGWLKFEASPKR